MYKTLTLTYLLNGAVYNQNTVHSFDNENLGTAINITVPEDYEDFSFVMDCQNGTVTKQYSLGSGETSYTIELDDSLTLTGTLELQLWATILSNGETVKVQWQKFNLTIDDALNISQITAEDNPDIIATHTSQLAYLMGIITDTGDGTKFLSDDGTYKTGGSGGTTDYTLLTNKPQINSVELIGNKTSADLGLQPAGSYLTTEVDPTVSAWAKAPTKPTYTYSEVGAEPANANIQTHISDSNIHLTSTEKTNVGKLASNGDGNSYLANDGTYKSGSSTDSTKVLKSGDTMTGDLNFTNSGINDANYLDLDTGAVTTPKTGRMHWNNAEKCLVIDTTSGGQIIPQRIGQSIVVRVNNNTSSTILKGQGVYSSGGLGERPTIGLAQANNIATSLPFIGLTLSDIPAGEDGLVMVEGLVTGLNTDAYNVGQTLYLSSTVAGGFQTTRPNAPNVNVIIGSVRVKSATDGVIGVLYTVVPFLRSLSDVYAPTPANNDMMKYNSSAFRWESTTADVYKTYAGFVNRTDSTLSVNASGVVNLAPTSTSFTVYINGTKKVISSTQTVTVTDDQTITYITLDSAGVLQKSLSVWDLTDLSTIPVAICFKDGSTYALTGERHGYERNKAWHKWAHNNIGTMYRSGFTGTFTNTTLSITQGIIYDEDLDFDSGGTKTVCSHWYRNATTGMRLVRGSNYAKSVSGGGVLQYDNGSGTLQDVSINNYVTNWVHASNDTTEPIYCVIGQNNSNTLALAQNASAPVINLSTREWKLLYRVIYQRTNGVPSGVFIEATDFRTVQTGVAITGVTTDHNALINRDATGSHPATAISYNATNVSAELDARINKTYTLDILTGDWSTNTFAQQITGLTNTDIVLVQAPDSYYTTYGLSYTQSGDTITFTVTSTPTETLSLGIAVTKAVSEGAL